MTPDDHDGDDPLQDRGDGDKPTRDARGRWLRGNCPNPKGRPKKKPKVLPDQSDIRIFGHTMVDVLTSGQKETMDRRTALLNKMFESAMKGKVSQQRFLYKEFERNDERLAAARVYYDQMMLYWFVDHPDRRNPDFDIPIEVVAEMEGLRNMLNYYYPFNYPIPGKSYPMPGQSADYYSNYDYSDYDDSEYDDG